MIDRKRLLLVVAVAAMLVLAGCVSAPGAGDSASGVGDGPSPSTPTVDGELELHHIDVGQADATLLVTPENETILIDSGDWRSDGSEVIDYLGSRNIDRIDHLVATHAHADHVGGHAAVIEHFEEHGDGVGAAYDSGVAHTSQTYENYLDAVEGYDVQLYDVTAGDRLPLEDEQVNATVLNPPAGESGTDLHENSVVLSIEFGAFSYLTTGDAEAGTEQRLVEEWSDRLESDVYQAGHHGSSTSSIDPKLDASTPEIAVISSAQASQYDHPSAEVLESFDDRGIETYWTAVHGDVVVTTDGDSSSVATEREAPTDPGELIELKE